MAEDHGGPYSVLFITADQWTGTCLSALGHHCVRTPHLDALAADGVLFRNHFTQCSPCGPARASLLTGMYLMNHRSARNGTPLDARHSNLAFEARKAGYDPILFGYTDTSADPRGLEADDPRLLTYEGVLPGLSVGLQMTEAVVPWRADLRAKGYEFPDAPDAVYRAVGHTPGPDGEQRPRPVYPAEHSDNAFVADKILDYLSAHKGEPWFVHAVLPRPHPPIIAPEPYNAMYGRSEAGMPRRLASPGDEARQHPYMAYLIERQRRPGYYWGHGLNIQALDDEALADIRAVYFGLISEVDFQIGRLIAHLKSTGEYDRTLIVFTSDHGEMLGDHWLFSKEGYFDQAYHIPMILRDPRPAAQATRGQSVQAFSEAIDIMPTILDWLGASIPPQCDGASLRPFLEGGQAPQNWRREVHWEFDFRDIEAQTAEQALSLHSDQCNLAVIRDHKYKYVHFAALPPLFFDLESDPGEFHNLASDPSYRDQVLTYAQKMLSWRMAYNERVLTNTLLTPKGMLVRDPAGR
jgi:arylsulfatase A-like enzyme